MTQLLRRFAPLALALPLLLSGGCGSSEATGASEAEPTSLAPPTQSDEKREAQIASLIEKAEEAVGDRRLTTPETDSALYYYELALAIEPTHQGALQGRHELATEYVALAETAWKRGDEEQKENYLRLAATVAPSAPELVAARSRLAEPSPAPAPPPAERAGGGYPTIRAAKVAYRDGRIDRYEYDRIARYYSRIIKEKQHDLKKAYRAGRITKREYRDQARAIERKLKG